MYNRITKDKARMLFDEGKTIFLLPSKTSVNSVWIKPSGVNYESGFFDSVVNRYAFYNCNGEMGMNVAFYEWKQL